MRKIGPHSRPHKLAVIDGRRAEAKRMKEIHEELVQHIGGAPSIAQRMLIERAAVLMLRMELMDRESMRGGDMTERDQRAYLGWHNAVSRTLRHLGLEKAPAPSLTAADAIRELRNRYSTGTEQGE